MMAGAFLGPGGFDGGFPPPRDPLFEAFDADSDGEISADEIEAASTVLQQFDKNGDGELTGDELPGPTGERPTRPQRPPVEE